MLFLKPVDTVKFYKKNRRRAKFTSFLLFLITIALTVGGCLVIASICGASIEIEKLKTAVAKLSDAGMKGTVGCVLGAVIFVSWLLFIKKFRVLRAISKSVKAYDGDYSDPVSDFVKEKLLYSHLQKNNSFGIGSFIMGLLFLTCFYSTIFGLLAVVAKVESIKDEFTCFKPSSDNGIAKIFKGEMSGLKMADKVGLGSLVSFGLLFVFLFFTQQLKMRRINEIGTMCGKDQPEMLYGNNEVVMPRLLRNNKRNKLFIYITFCVLGFPIFFFFKRASATLYRSNINNKFS